MADGPTHPAAEIAEILDRAGLGYVLIGGLAVNTWVVPRFTADIDMVVLASPAAISRAEAALQAAGFEYLRRQDAGEPSGPDFIRMTQRASGTTVDLQVAKTPLQDQVVARARVDPSGAVRVATAEDLIVLKLIAGRSKDQRDLFELMRLAGLDWAYIAREAAIWGLGERLAAARARVADEPVLP